MKIPDKVKIQGVTYKVIIADDWVGSFNTYGETFQNKKQGNVIYIKSDLSDEAKMNTFIHECLHCMNSTMNHEFLDSLATQLYQFLTENNLLK